MNDNNNQEKPVCIFQSPAGTRSGYGDLGVELGKSLLRSNKFDLMTVCTKWGGCSRKDFTKLTDPLEQELYKRIVTQQLTKQPEIFIQVSIPSEMMTPAKYNININAGIESTLAPDSFVTGLNLSDLNIVTSTHSKKVFEEAVYQPKQEPNQPPKPILKSIKPIEVLFWGANTSIYGNDKPSQPTIDEELKSVKEDFNFLFVGQWCGSGLFNDRKDIGNLIKHFLITFSKMGNKTKPGLIIKTSGAAICNMDKHDMINRLRSIRMIVERELNTTDLPNVYIVYGELTDQEMNALYNHSKIKAHISFTRGEGFGKPLLEASLSGKPLLVSGWSGHLDFLDPKLCKLLDGEIKPISQDCVNQWLIQGSSHFVVNYQKAQEAMKNCFYYYGNQLEKAEQLRIRNKELFSTEAMDKKFWEILDKYLPKFSLQRTIVLPKLRRVSPVSSSITT